ncbi:MAG: peptide deformylase [Candidatus Harrisonbacteria bacterium RIFCSPLOWO2_02_FULL_45_10c]|uniref:Peptide deformylase n=1 Tax=Candidatus Harrisonbacteria bacterium RIFCSPLOWO2_02_FULL_45_10c TaxID=1798410 RepID=A0A1G1ZRW2_9BACT|nr:MAG: peptide deformylase [Candidatus Harrisonbacteria bacterium RIFCSPLOWO2_02_FULL_45_10c]
MTEHGIWTINNKKELGVLRGRARNFDFDSMKRSEINSLIRRMRETMRKANGVGLSANQIGLDFNLFVAQIEGKFYAIFNSKITKISSETVTLEEGCLSVPEVFGNVPRSLKVTLEGFTKDGKKIKIRAWGLLARVFQHETDHLSGKVFIDRTKDIHKYVQPKS